MEVREKNFVLKNFFRNYLSLNRSREDESATVESIRNGVEFKGINLWVLIFATLDDSSHASSFALVLHE